MNILDGIKNLDEDLHEKLQSDLLKGVKEEEEAVGNEEAHKAFRNIEKILKNSDLDDTELKGLSKRNNLLFSDEENEGEEEKGETSNKTLRNVKKKTSSSRDTSGRIEGPETQESGEEKVEEEQAQKVREEQQRNQSGAEAPEKTAERPRKVVEVVRTRKHERGEEGDEYLKRMRDVVERAKSEMEQKKVIEKSRKTPVNLTPDGEVEGYYGKGSQALQSLKDRLGYDVKPENEEEVSRRHDLQRHERGKGSETGKRPSGQSVEKVKSEESFAPNANDKEEYLQKIEDLIQREMEKRDRDKVLQEAMKTPVQVDSSGEVKGYFGRGEQAVESIKEQMNKVESEGEKVELSAEDLDEKIEFERLVEEVKKLERKIEQLESETKFVHENKKDLSIIRDLRSVAIENREKIQDLEKKSERRREKLDKIGKNTDHLEEEIKENMDKNREKVDDLIEDVREELEKSVTEEELEEKIGARDPEDEELKEAVNQNQKKIDDLKKAMKEIRQGEMQEEQEFEEKTSDLEKKGRELEKEWAEKDMDEIYQKLETLSEAVLELAKDRNVNFE